MIFIEQIKRSGYDCPSLNESFTERSVDISSLLKSCHPEWMEILTHSFATMNKDYLQQLMDDTNWLPGPEHLLAAFSMPLSQTEYILLGESPYPRADSANGYAFWDNAVHDLWSDKGLSKAVNRATSLRNWIKMMLVARGTLEQGQTSQEHIANTNKNDLVKTGEQLFDGMMRKGILLLNACLVYSEGKVPYHARQWKPFMQDLLTQLAKIKPDIQLILLGKIAEMVLPNQLSVGLLAEHPYNISFISNPKVIAFFKPLDLLAYE